jgi:predicted anti-sigma-YlaC factor YlaD
MVVVSQPTPECSQARQWISLRLDGELSELEGAALARHLDRCAACSAFAGELAGITQLMRSAPAAEPARTPSPRPAPRRRVPAVVRPAALAGVLSAAAAGVALLLAGAGTHAQRTASAFQFRSVAEEVRYLRVEQRRIEPKHPNRVPAALPMNPRGLL